MKPPTPPELRIVYAGDATETNDFIDPETCDLLATGPAFAFLVNGDRALAREFCGRLVRFLASEHLPELLDKLGVPK